MILYFGNYIAKHGFTPTMCELLSEKLSEKYHIIRSSDKKVKAFRLFDMLFTLFYHRNKAGLILIDTYSYRSFWYAYLISHMARSFKIKYFPIIRGGNFASRIEKSPVAAGFVLSNAHKIIVLSGFMKELMLKHGYNNVIEIPNYIPLDDYKFRLRKKPETKLLWVRSFHKIYNPSLTVEIVEKLIEKNLNPVMCMVGPDKDGSMIEIKKLIAEKGLTDNFIITGKMDKKEWISLSEKYDIFISTTNIDNFPLSVIEAMALGLPVISTNVGGVPYIIKSEENGFLINKGDADEFAEKIVDLTDKPELVLKVTKNARSYTEKLDWQIIKNKWFALIDNPDE